jgi:hypothetical protein
MKLNEIKQKTDIASICKQYHITNYVINDDGSIDVKENVSFFQKPFTKFPVKFGRVTGNFCCGESNITSLEDGPSWVGGKFLSFSCPNLRNLKGAPKWVGEVFNVGNCENLMSIEDAPPFVGDYINLNACRSITKFEGFEKMNNSPYSTSTLFMKNVPISNLLAIFRLKGLQNINSEHDELDKIVNKHLAGDRDIMECQDELIEAGFKRYANLK